MIKPVITLGAIQYNGKLSEVTSNYSAVLYVDGVKWGSVANSGLAGPDRFHGLAEFRNGLVALNHRIAATYPKMMSGGTETTPTLELVCAQLLDTYLVRRRLLVLLKRNVIFRAKGKTMLVGIAINKAHTMQSHYDYVLEHYPSATILNCLPVEEALTIYRASLPS